MAFGIFLNFEKLSTKIVEDAISYMNDDNVLRYDDGSCDEINEEDFLKNLYHGSIAATFIVNLYETALNTIITRRLGCTELDILKTSHNVKLQLICTMFHVDFSEIKRDNYYSLTKSIIKLRNDITHFKNNEIAEGHYITSDAKIPMGTTKESLATMFTKTYMEKCYEGVVKFLDMLCEKCGLVLNKECEIIDCDGRDMLCEYIVSKDVFEDSSFYES